MSKLESLDGVAGLPRGRSLALFAWGLALVAGCVIVAWRASQGAAFLSYEMNSDTLLAPVWVEDIRSHAYAWTGFQLARIPSFFPDLLLQWLARSVSPDARWGVFVCCAAQFTGLVFAAGWMVRLAGGASYLKATTAAFALLSVAVLLETFLGASAIPLMWFQSCAHTGPFILVLLATGLATRLRGSWRLAEALGLFAATTLAVLSDRLVLAELVLPCAVAILILAVLARRAPPRRDWAILGVLAAAVLLATGLDTLVYREADVPIVLSGFGARIGQALGDIPAFAAHNPASLIVACLFPLAALASFPWWASGSRGRAVMTFQANGANEPRLGAMESDATFVWLNAAGAFVIVGVSTVLLVYVGPSSVRYMAGVSLWPLVFAAALLCKWRRIGRVLAWLTAAGVGAVLLTAAIRPDARPGPVSWRSPLATCLAEQAPRFGLQTGFGDYWTARETTFDGRGGVRIEQLDGTGRARVYGSDAFDMVERPDGADRRPPAFNYIVPHGLDEAVLAGRYGAPDKTFHCEAADRNVWVYADAPRVTRLALDSLKPPQGSYLGTCQAVMVQTDLFTRCPAADGTPRYSHLRNGNACFSDITVEDGQIVADCARPFRRIRRMLTPPKRRPPPS